MEEDGYAKKEKRIPLNPSCHPKATFFMTPMATNSMAINRTSLLCKIIS